ncbi:MAG: hypothetical protein M3014_07175 [Chloroflexota bacterium]|nr:hypothetical protein [Chloroflexota bacterium]
MAAAQGVLPITDFNQLLGEPWPDDESAEQFMEAIRELRESSLADRSL